MNGNNELAFCAQFNKQSGRVPNSGIFCGHDWIFRKWSRQIVDYGGVMVYGTHGHWNCNWCGKNRIKVYTGKEYRVYTRKEINDYYKTSIWANPRKEKQLEFV